MPKYSNIAVEGGRRTTWAQSTPLGNLVGVTNSSEVLGQYNKQFSARFIKTGLVGAQPRMRKGLQACLLIKKATKEVKVVIQKC